MIVISQFDECIDILILMIVTGDFSYRLSNSDNCIDVMSFDDRHWCCNADDYIDVSLCSSDWTCIDAQPLRP